MNVLQFALLSGNVDFFGIMVDSIRRLTHGLGPTSVAGISFTHEELRVRLLNDLLFSYTDSAVFLRQMRLSDWLVAYGKKDCLDALLFQWGGAAPDLIGRNEEMFEEYHSSGFEKNVVRRYFQTWEHNLVDTAVFYGNHGLIEYLTSPEPAQLVEKFFMERCSSFDVRKPNWKQCCENLFEINVTAVYYAVVSERPKVLRTVIGILLASASKLKEAVNANVSGNRPLLVAMKNTVNGLEMVETLLDAGADPMLYDSSGSNFFTNLLMFASSSEQNLFHRDAILRLILQKYSSFEVGKFISGSISRGKSPFLSAVAEKRMDIIEFLISNNFDVGFLATDANKNTALHLSVSSQDPKITEYILSLKDVHELERTENSQGYTPVEIGRSYFRNQLGAIVSGAEPLSNPIRGALKMLEKDSQKGRLFISLSDLLDVANAATMQANARESLAVPDEVVYRATNFPDINRVRKLQAVQGSIGNPQYFGQPQLYLQQGSGQNFNIQAKSGSTPYGVSVGPYGKTTAYGMHAMHDTRAVYGASAASYSLPGDHFGNPVQQFGFGQQQQVGFGQQQQVGFGQQQQVGFGQPQQYGFNHQLPAHKLAATPAYMPKREKRQYEEEYDENDDDEDYDSKEYYEY